MPRRFSPSDAKFIEEIAQQRVKFNRILKEQTAVFRDNVPEYEAALARFQQSGALVQPGQHWQPPPDKADAYISDCEKQCQLVPQTLDELSQLLNFGVIFLLTIGYRRSRVRVMHAAHAAIAWLILCKMGSRPSEAIHFAIKDRMRELGSQSPHPTPPVTPESKRSSSSRPSPMLSHNPSPQPRLMTADEITKLHNNPDILHGRKFVLSPDTDDPARYEVSGYYRKRDKSFEYEILFDDCPDDPIKVDAAEMQRMLRDSAFIPI